MKKTDSHISNAEMRELLGRWYSGTTTPAEEHLLAEALAGKAELPADLEADARLFRELTALGASETEMPEEYSSRITAALEREMAASRRKTPGDAFWRSSRFRRIGAAAVIAVCLSFIGGVALWDSTGTQLRGGETLATVSGQTDKTQNVSPIVAEAEDSVIMVFPERGGLEAPAEKNLPKGRKPGVIRSVASAKAANENLVAMADIEKPETPEAEVYDFLTPEEEAMLADSRYRVVTDSDEANAILSSVFAQLEAKVDIQANNISMLHEEYEVELNKLNTIINVSTIN